MTITKTRRLFLSALTSSLLSLFLVRSTSTLAFAPAQLLCGVEQSISRRSSLLRRPPYESSSICHSRPAFVIKASSSDEISDDSTSDAAVIDAAPFPDVSKDEQPAGELPALSSSSSSLSSSPSPPSSEELSALDFSSPSSSSTTTFMITREMRRVLIEELRYTREEADAMRIDLAGPVVAKRISRPPEGMPESWRQQDDDLGVDRSGSGGGMLGKLERESRYPFRVPLLGVSLILAGKGLADAIITVIKVNMGFPGASLMEEFMGVNVLAIDLLCVVIGIGLGSWTWRTMKD